VAKSTDTKITGRIRNLPFCKTFEHLAMSDALDLLASASAATDPPIARNCLADAGERHETGTEEQACGLPVEVVCPRNR
jgi:hypothetical protein